MFDFDLTDDNTPSNIDLTSLAATAQTAINGNTTTTEVVKKRRGRKPKNAMDATASVDTEANTKSEKNDIMKHLDFVYTNYSKIPTVELAEQISATKTQVTRLIKTIQKNLEQAVVDGKLSEDEYQQIVNTHLTPAKASRKKKNDMSVFDPFIEKAIKSLREESKK